MQVIISDSNLSWFVNVSLYQWIDSYFYSSAERKVFVFCVVGVEKRRPESLMSDRGRWASPDWPSAQSLLLVATFILHHWYVTSRSSEKHICFNDNKTAINKTCILVWSSSVVYQCYFVCFVCVTVCTSLLLWKRKQREETVGQLLCSDKSHKVKKQGVAQVWTSKEHSTGFSHDIPLVWFECCRFKLPCLKYQLLELEINKLAVFNRRMPPLYFSMSSDGSE